MAKRKKQSLAKHRRKKQKKEQAKRLAMQEAGA